MLELLGNILDTIIFYTVIIITTILVIGLFYTPALIIGGYGIAGLILITLGLIIVDIIINLKK